MSSVLLLGVAAPLLGFSQSTPNSQVSMETEFQAAMAAQEHGDLARSTSILISLRRRHAGIFAIDESLGMNYVAQERYVDAVPILQDATRDDSTSDLAFANLGAALFKLHRHQEALEAFERAAQLNPHNALTQQSLGEVSLATGKPQQAARAYAAALAVKPDDRDLELASATAFVAAGEQEKAERLLTGIPGGNDAADVQALLAQADEKKGNYQEAVAHFTRAAEIEPSEENVWALGVEFLHHWTFEAAIRELEFATQRFPDSTRMKLGLGAAYFGGAQYAKAIPVFSGLLDGADDRPIYAELLGMACTAVTESAQKQCGPLLQYAEKHPKDAKANTYAATMLLTETTTNTGTALARKLLTNALASDPQLAEAHYRMGILEQNQGAWEASIAPLQRSIALKPDFAAAHYRLALAYWRGGRKEEGQSEMELEKKYSQQKQQDLNQRLREITTFIVDDQH